MSSREYGAGAHGSRWLSAAAARAGPWEGGDGALRPAAGRRALCGRCASRTAAGAAFPASNGPSHPARALSSGASSLVSAHEVEAALAEEAEQHLRAYAAPLPAEDDPLLGPDAVHKLKFSLDDLAWETRMSLAFKPHSQAEDRKVKLRVRLRRLKLATAWARRNVAAIAGPRYDAQTGVLTLTCDAHPTAAANRRALLETLQQLCEEAEAIDAEMAASAASSRDNAE